MISSHGPRRGSNKHVPKGGNEPQFLALRKRLAANVIRLRGDLGLTQMEAADQARLGWRHLQKIEAGESNATLSTLAQLGAALDVDPATLLAPLRKRGVR